MIDYGSPDEAERAALAELLAHAYAVARDDYMAWFPGAGLDNLRIVRRAGEVVGGLGLVPMGQFFGGRSVPMTGIASVGVRSDAQRRGVATELMRAALLELAEQGTALSMLYASTQALYRKVDYETAGSRFIARLTPLHIGIDERGLALRRPAESDLARVEAFYRERAAHQNGHLDRGPYIWKRVHGERRGLPAYGILAEAEGGALEGYLFYRKVPGEVPQHRVTIVDCLATTPAAWRRLWSFVRDLSTRVVDEITIYTAPADPALLVHPDPRFPVELLDNWMIRVVDAPAALRARGYPAGLRLDLELEIADSLIPGNAGRFWLRIADGAAEVERGGAGRLRLDARGLASLYSGFADPIALARLGRLDGEPSALAAAAAAFAGPAPWTRDMF